MTRVLRALLAALVAGAAGAFASAAELAPRQLDLPPAVELASPHPAAISLQTTDARINFVALHGTVSPAMASGGRVRADFRADGGRIPRVAIIAALATDGSVVAWGSVPLHGTAVVTARSKPAASVRLVVGSREYGPAVADGRGETKFEVTVPPGVRTARAFAEDRLGATKESDVEISPPPFSRVLALCSSSGTLTVLAVGTAGGPASLDAVDARADTGAFGPLTLVEPGRWEATLDPTLATSDRAAVTVGIAGDAASVASCAMPVPPEQPSSVQVDVGATTYRAGSAVEVPVTIRLAYPGRRTKAAVTPTVAVDFGRISGVRATDDGRFEAVWTLPDVLEGRREGTVSVNAESATGAGRLAIRPGPASRIEAQPPAEPLRADGRTETSIAVRAYDAYGNVAAGPLDASAENGHADGIRDGDGIARYVPPVLHRKGSDTLRLRADEAVLVLPITLRPVPRTFSLGVHAGWTTNLARVSAPRGSVEVTTRLPLFGDRVAAGLEAGWLPVQTRLRAPGETVHVTVTAVPVLGRASVDVVRRPVSVAVGAAGGAMIARTTTSSATTGRAETVEPSLAAGAFTGVSRQFGHASFGVELWWRHARVETPTLDGSLGGPGAELFYRWEF